MSGPRFWARWAARDLRGRWAQVAAIALVLALGTGVYAGLNSAATWRRESNDASYAALGMFDLKATLTEGSFADRGELEAAALALPGRPVERADERLVVATSVDASTGGQAVLVPGRLVGADVTAAVNRLEVREGRALAPSDDGLPVGILEMHFAAFHGLPPTGTVRLSGGTELRYVGTGLAPEYFMVITEGGGFLAEANFAVVFASLRTAQAVSGHADKVNDLVVHLRPGADLEDAQAALRTALPNARVTTRADDPAYHLLYQDIEGDQKVWNVVAGLILAGAIVAAFNLAGRMVDAQRRQIGVSMALGLSPLRIGLRPLLAGAEIALLGSLLGVGVGYVVMLGMRALFESLLPLPVWRMGFQPAPFIRAAILGIVLPVVATAWPVWRAVRVTPVEALRTGHLAARPPRLIGLARRLPLGGSLTRMPFRNVLRAPHRTVATALGIGAAITALVGTLGIIDSFVGTLHQADAEATRSSPDRLEVELDGLHLGDAPAVRSVTAAPEVGRTEPALRLGGMLEANGARVEVLVDVIDLRAGLWRPSIERAGERDVTTGLVLSRTAADDLRVQPGQSVTLVHPKRVGQTMTLARSRLVVAAVHPSPMRFATYLDSSQAESVLGLAGVANRVIVEPAPGTTADEVERALFGLTGVASVQPVTTMTRLLEDAMDEFVGILRFLEGFVLLLALLIAFNASSISVDERSRDHATMFAFGLPVRTVVRMNVVEGLATGLLGTAIGLVLGSAVLRWIVQVLLPETMPEIGLSTILSPATIVTALLLGVLAVALAPLLTYRRLRSMDVPAALRVLE